MIHFDDLTERELAFRKLLQQPGAFARWAREVRAAWLRTPEGRRAVRECEGKRGKRRRRVDLEG